MQIAVLPALGLGQFIPTRVSPTVCLPWCCGAPAHVLTVACGICLRLLLLFRVKMGPERAAQLLAAGCNDMGGSIMNESITKAAGEGQSCVCLQSGSHKQLLLVSLYGQNIGSAAITSNWSSPWQQQQLLDQRSQPQSLFCVQVPHSAKNCHRH